METDRPLYTPEATLEQLVYCFLYGIVLYFGHMGDMSTSEVIL